MSHERAVIRRAEVRDLSRVATVARATWRVAYAGIIPYEVQRRLLDRWYSRESLSRALAAQGSSFFVAESRGNVVGFAQFVRRSLESVELTQIYVLPDRQRNGIGMQLLQVFTTDVGLTPKMFSRVLRFQRVLALIRRDRQIDWADVAVAGGYYDQAHFIHDFRAFSGMNPTAYLRADVREPNHVPLLD